MYVFASCLVALNITACFVLCRCKLCKLCVVPFAPNRSRRVYESCCTRRCMQRRRQRRRRRQLGWGGFEMRMQMFAVFGHCATGLREMHFDRWRPLWMQRCSGGSDGSGGGNDRPEYWRLGSRTSSRTTRTHWWTGRVDSGPYVLDGRRSKTQARLMCAHVLLHIIYVECK